MILKYEYVITYINNALIYLVQCVFQNREYSHHHLCTFGFLWDKTIYDKLIYTSYDLILMKKRYLVGLVAWWFSSYFTVAFDKLCLVR